MKYLSHYTDAPLTAALDNAGAFYAFGNDQFEERRKPGIKYVDMGMGLICPKENADQLFKDMQTAIANGIRADIEENGKEKIIIRELYNHECFYTGSIEDAIDKLKAYGIEEPEIMAAYRKEYPTASENF